ncbi:MAG: hypothetical protein ACI9VR_005201 [Cognaticolwellia sp.]|jgi:hypothetical protein
MTLLLSLFLALTPPSAPDLTSAESATLSERKPIVRTSSDGLTVLAVIDVVASPAKVMAAVLDVQARRDEVGSIEEVTIYAQTPTQMKVRYDISLMGFDAVMNLIYDIDAANHFVKYSTDTSLENDIEGSSGSYHAVTLPNGATRLYYRVNVPDEGAAWLKKALLEKNLPEQIQGIQRRAEQ